MTTNTAQQRPLWLDVTRPEYDTLQGDRTVDVAIVGAGFSGLGAAYALQDSGRSAAVLEERTVAGGASGRNAGFVLAGPAQPFGRVVADLGAEEALRIWQLTADNNRMLAELIGRWDIACGYLRRGSMSLAASDAEWQDLHHTYHDLEGAGISACLVAGEALPRPFDRLYHGGVYFPGNAELNPGQLLRAAARRLAHRVEIFEYSPVVELHQGTSWRVRTPGGTVHAKSVILAANAYSARLAPSLPISPTRGQVAATGPLPRVIVPFPLYANYGFEYWRQTPEGQLVAGGWRNLDVETEVGTDETLHPAIQQALEEFIRRVAGEAAGIVYRWAGIMGFTPDFRPLVGPLGEEPGLYIAAGYSGHGVSMAWTCGTRVAQLAMGAPADIPPAFRPDRFPALRSRQGS